MNRTFDVRIHGFIDCLTVVGNEAWFAGHVTQSNEDFRVGGIRGFRVVDNGEGEDDPPDQIAHSTLLPLSDPLVETAQDWCDKTPENRRLLDIEQGNIQVSSQSAASKRLVGPASVEGQIGPGSLYRLEIPADWNGDLAVYAHGARNVASSIFLGPNTPLQTLLLEKGFGIAHSSFSENGYNIGDAAIRTRQLLGLFNSTFGRPRNTYIHGLSMGGLRALLLVERNPQLFDGAMSVCGMVGGASFSRDQVLNTQVLFDYFYPDVLGGSPIQPEPWLESVEIDVLIALGGGLDRARQIAAVDQVSIEYDNESELINTIMRRLRSNANSFSDLFDRQHGHNGFDNTTTDYFGSVEDGALNDGVARFSADPDAVQVRLRWYEPDGNLELPFITLHTTRDPVVPALHVAIYAEKVEAAGKAHLLAQRFIDGYGHCRVEGNPDRQHLAANEAMAVFEELVEWVRTGTKPEE